RVANAAGKLSFPLDSARYQLQKFRLEAEGVIFTDGRFSLAKFGWLLP
ncbi:MAG TPA: methyltransferase, partial [Gammaproteobacteria bacterium]|nr:methyltransferase [Gammaproteobacteria bacterium]